VVLEHLTEQATRVVVAVDRSPTMDLFPPELPWLRKPQAVAEARRLIVASALQAGCLANDDDGESADGEDVRRALERVLELDRPHPAGSFLFVLSDFLSLPPEPLWLEALRRGLDLVPVLIQDPVWERSFPQVAGAVLPVVDPLSGRPSLVRLSRVEAAAQRAENEARHAAIAARFAELGLEPVHISSHDRGHVFEAFLDWARRRYRGARLAR
jgi:hypothetical protein